MMCQYFLEPICDLCVFFAGLFQEWRAKADIFSSYELVGSVYLMLKVDKLHEKFPILKGTWRDIQ